MTRTDLKLWQTLQFLVRLLILSVPLYLVIHFSLDLTLIQHLFAGATASILSTLGWTVQLNNIAVTVTSPDRFTFLIVRDCTAWKSALFLFALLLAVPRRKSHPNRRGFLLEARLPALLIGMTVLVAGNLVRILTSVWVRSIYGPALAEFVHSMLWQFGLIALVLAVWYAWLRKWYINPAGKH